MYANILDHNPNFEGRQYVTEEKFGMSEPIFRKILETLKVVQEKKYY